MCKRYFFLIPLFIPFCVFSQQLASYRYWFDNDFANAVSTSSSNTTINLSINTTSIKEGYHQLNFQAQDAKGFWSVITKSDFVKTNSVVTQQMKAYRYWFDDDFTHAITVNSSNTVFNVPLNATPLANGTHQLNVQWEDNSNYWSAILTTDIKRVSATAVQIAQKAIKPDGIQKIVGDPIQLGTGSYTYSHKDFSLTAINGTLDFERFYNSLNNIASSQIGNGWSHTFNFNLDNQQDTSWNIHYPDGHIEMFTPDTSTGFSTPFFSSTFDSLKRNNHADFTYLTKDKKQFHFSSTGKLDSIVDLNNNVTKLYYTENNIDSVVAPGGRKFVLTYAGNYISSITDPLNRACNYIYDGNNNLITVTNANNGNTNFTYDANNRMLKVINALGYTVVDNTYDVNGKVILQKDAYNNATTIAYNTPGTGDATVTNPDNSTTIAHHDAYIRKTLEQDELGFSKIHVYDINSNETSFTNENTQTESKSFDAYGNLISDTLPGNKITLATYNSLSSPIQITDAKSNQKAYYYNSSNNNLDSIRFPDNSLQTFSYNSNGQIIHTVDGNGNTTVYTYSATGDVLTIQTYAGTKQYSYDAAGRRIAITDENGNTNNYVYDSNDNITKITDALGNTIENIYDAGNQLLTIKDKNGFKTSLAYDQKGRKISSTNAKGKVTTYAYDVRDNLISVIDANNNLTSYTYDVKGRKNAMINALGITHYQYDAVGNLLKVIDPTNKTTEYTYSNTNKKLTQKDGLGNTTNFVYDNNDNLITVADPLNRITGYGYDVMNRLVSVTDAMNKTTSVTYDKNGNKKTVVDPNGHTQTYSYDAANRMITYQDAAGNNYSYSYDSVGNIKLLTKPTGTIAKVFDAANRVTTVNNSSGDNYHFTYDNNDHIISMSNAVGTTHFTYDSINQLTQYQDPYNKTVAYTYDAVGNKKSLIYSDNKTVSYTYDNANNVKTVTDWLSHVFTYTYDSAGRTTQLLYPNNAKCNYTFDNAGRLLSKVNKLSNDSIISGSVFTLDAIGNRTSEQRQGPVPSGLLNLSKAYNYGNDDRMLTDSIWNFTNDNSGNRTAETNGSKSASYSFSVDNLLNSMVDTSGTNNVFTYDVLGHRISKAVGSNTNRYVLDLGSSLSQIVQITDASGVIKSNYVYGLGLLETVDANNNALYYHFDGQHNTVLLTDQNAVVKDSYTYDPFGKLLTHSGSSVQPFSFLGEYGVEQETASIYYARARYFDATNGRFISKDSYDYDLNNPQTINRYSYAINNPIIIYDPTGLYGNQDISIQNKNNHGYLNYLYNNTTVFDLGGIATDLAKVTLEYFPKNAVTSLVSKLNSFMGDAFIVKDAIDITKAMTDFEADIYYNNHISGSEWAHTLKTIAVTGTAMVVGLSVTTALTAVAAPVAVVAGVSAGIGIVTYAIDKTIDYFWGKNNWDKALNKLF